METQKIKERELGSSRHGHQMRSESPVPSCVSMRSDQSMDPPLKFKDGAIRSNHNSSYQKRSDSPVPSCVSMKSDQSMDPPLKFRDEGLPLEHSLPHPVRLKSPVASCVSMKSNQSMDPPLKFKGQADPCGHGPVHQERSESPVPSCLSTKSDQSMDPPLKFKDGVFPNEHSPLYPMHLEAPEPSCVSMKSHQSMDPPLKFKDSLGQTFNVHLSQIQERLGSSVPSCVSMKSDQSMDPPLKFKAQAGPRGHSPVHQKRSESPVPSFLSTKSDQSMDPPLKFKDGAFPNEHSLLHPMHLESPGPSCVSMRSHQSMDPPLKFKDPFGQSPIQERLGSPVPSCASIKSHQSMDPPLKFTNGEPLFEYRKRAHNHQVDLESQTPSSVSMKIDDSMEPPVKLRDGAVRSGHSYESEPDNSKVHEKLKSNLKVKFQCLCEGIAKQGNPTLLNEIYTELYITEGGDGEISNEHEVRQIEASSRRAAIDDTPINCNDIFKPLSGQNKLIRTVLTKGVAGIGKTISVQKFVLDWAEGKENEDLRVIFPLPFRELNLIRDQKVSIKSLLNMFFTQAQEMNLSSYKQTLFIFDGLDECRLSLDFKSSVRLSDVNESASVDVLLTNLIKGNLLPSALIWITSRPAAADLIPSECVDRVTEVRGFNDPQKEEYFRKRISDESLANRIITHLKSSRSLYIMCHIPVFCWISATVLERMLSEAESGEIPKTLTQMYTHFLIIQTNIKKEKAYRKKVEDDNMIICLGKLAFQQLIKGNLIFYEEDLRDCGIDVTEASVYSGLCTQIFREEFGLYQGKVFCFVHLSIQEHLAALYVHHSFTNNNINVMEQITKPSLFTKISDWFKYGSSKEVSISDLHQRAVDEALKSKNGHLDLFLRFLLGLSPESNQTLLQSLLVQMRQTSGSREETVNYIKKKIRENPSPEKFINLFHCLNELGDHSLVDEIQSYLTSGKIREAKLSPSQWSAMTFVLLTSVEEQDVFNLDKYDNKYSLTDEGFLNLMPVIEASRSAMARMVTLTHKSCEALALALSSKTSSLRDLDLHSIQFPSSGIKLFFDGLVNPHCKLETLSLELCKLTEKSCVGLASVLSSESSCLKVLKLSSNKLQNAGVKEISVGLKSPHCKLEMLRLCSCGVTDEGCAALGSALTSDSTRLQKLDLSDNELEDSGVKLLSAGLEHPNCKVDMLRLRTCGVSGEGCAALASALKSNPSHLKELDLSDNKLGDSGVKLLSAGIESPHCNLEILRLHDCELTENSCEALASALNFSSLRELELMRNKLLDSGVKLLCAGLQNPHCILEKLWLNHCGATDDCCTALAAALKCDFSHLKELDLSWNELQDSGVKLLCAGLEDVHCVLETLMLNHCRLTDKGCAALASALRSNPSHLRKLELTVNYLSHSGVKLLSTLKDDPHFALDTLKTDEDS